MIGIDTNLLVYSHRRESEWHAKARALIKGLAEGADSWAIPWPCIHEFLAIVTNARIYKPATPVEVALNQVQAWLGSPSLTVIGDTPRHWDELREIVAAGRIAGAAVHDARIAAICRAHGVREFWTADRDFSRIRSFGIRNPLLT